MARLSMDQIKTELEDAGLEYVSGEYSNLKSVLNVKCHEGHEFLTSIHQVRRGSPCPICFQYENMDILESKIEAPPVKKGKRVLAIDNATYKTGYAIFEDGKYIHGGVKQTKKNDTAVRITEMKQWFVSMLLLWDIDVVGLENVQYQGNPQTLIVLAKLLGVLESAAYEITHKVPYIVPSVTWKSHSGVKGKNRDKQKENAQKVVKARYGITVSSDLADAILLGRYVCGEDKFGEPVKWGK